MAIDDGQKLTKLIITILESLTLRAVIERAQKRLLSFWAGAMKPMFEL
jgi:hypothetical protein